MTSDSEQKKRLLFVCTANMQRSPTAEHIFVGSRQYEARSAGTHPDAIQPISQALVEWAEMIFVMEEEHRKFIEERFDLKDTPVINLNIPDRFITGDPALLAILRKRVSEHIPIDNTV